MSKYHDDSTEASDPVSIGLDKKKLKRFKATLSIIERFTKGLFCSDDYLHEHLYEGDSRAAVVVALEPVLVVAAYTDELDCVVLLKFPSDFIDQYGLSVGSRLLTVNTYSYGIGVARDLLSGPRSFKRYSNFFPLIAEFLSSDNLAIDDRKASIDQAEWALTIEQGNQALARNITPRDGSPYYSKKPAG
ncbi:MAG: hypothetical protein HN350_06020 [Phycisphaerales bacterium]|jgi:hypothetical protein|nr:hypothetical protein [Phycisphaerales bacterium]